MVNYWSKEEIELLRKHYPLGGSIVCAQSINRPLSAIRYKAYELKISTKCKNGKTLVHPIIGTISGNRAIAICPIHGSVEHHTRKGNRGPRCKLCRKDYGKRPAVKEATRKWHKQYFRNPKQLYAHRLRVQLRQVIRNKEIGCFRFLPYSPKELRSHLENIKCNQNNCCSMCGISYNAVGFQIDHIIPLASACNDEEVLGLFALDNLSILCGSCNSQKGKRIL